MLQATPFVPGNVRGILRRGCISVSSDSILILTQQELGELDGRPAGIMVIDSAPFSHPMIRLLTLGIPTILISGDTVNKLEEGKEVVIDGFRGTIIKSPEAGLETMLAPEPPPGMSLFDGRCAISWQRLQILSVNGEFGMLLDTPAEGLAKRPDNVEPIPLESHQDNTEAELSEQEEEHFKQL